MKKALAVCFAATVLLAAAAAYAADVPIQGGTPSISRPSNLEGRYGIGLGWGYVHAIGAPTITGTTVTNGSILDAPKIITTKIGFSQNLALEPSLALSFINYDDKITKRTPLLLRIAPVLSYALFQKDRVNFNIKGGVSITYAKEITNSRYSDLIFAIPAGFGIEWWMLENLAFDASVMTDVIAFDVGKNSENGDSMTTFAMSLSNVFATLSLVFWF